MQEQLDFFAKNGYLVVFNALSSQEIRSINDAIDRDLINNRRMWRKANYIGRNNMNFLLSYPETDVTARPPTLLPIIQAIMGSNLCIDEHSAVIRPPNPDGMPDCMWHRDGEKVADSPYYCYLLSVIFYLTEVDDTTHTFSVISGTAQSSEFLPLDAYNLENAVHLVGPAGTAVLFNPAMFHAFNCRKTVSERRTIHICCGRTTQPSMSNYTIFPPRLWKNQDEDTCRYYSRLNPITKLLLEHF